MKIKKEAGSDCGNNCDCMKQEERKALEQVESIGTESTLGKSIHLVANYLRQARAREKKLEEQNKILKKQWDEMNYAYNYSKDNSRWHEERNGEAQSALFEAEK